MSKMLLSPLSNGPIVIRHKSHCVKLLPTKKISKPLGFTIVELLIVIAVIGILAAITIVSYTGIRQRAIASSLQLDLSNASTQLKLYQVTNDAYPTSNDCSSGPNPAPPKICLKTSPGNSYADFVTVNTTPQTFCVAVINNGIAYKITDGVGPTVGVCNTITTNPSGLIANGGTSQVVLNWAAPSDDGGSAITNYKIYQGTSAGGEALLTTVGNVLAYTSTGLSTGTTYYYKVTAVNTTGESGYSNEASGTTNPITYLLTTIAGTGGTVSSGGTYNTGSTPTITASPNAYYSFSSWSGSTGCSGAASHTITMDTNKSCTANFTPIPVSAPAAPTVAANTAGATTTWSWGAASCPGNSARYQYDYTINSGFDSGWTATAGTLVAFTTSTHGYTYTVAVQAQCYNAVTSSSWSGSGSAGYYSQAYYYYNKYTAPTNYVMEGGSTSLLTLTDTFSGVWPSYTYNSATNTFGGTGSRVLIYYAYDLVPFGPWYLITGGAADGSSGGTTMHKYLSTPSYDTWNDTIYLTSNSTLSRYQGTLVTSNINVPNGTYPDNGYNAGDGYWYVKGAASN